MNIVKMACERPDECKRSLSQWDCTEIQRELIRTGVVEFISVETVRRILKENKLKPWRYNMWLSNKVPRDAAFALLVMEIADLYTRELFKHEVVLSIDEKTSLQPRPRKSKTLPTKPGHPTRVECEYDRAGALNLLASFNTRTGQVIGRSATRKRQEEFILLLEDIDRQTSSEITSIYVVLDNLRMHTGKKVQAWLEKHPRFIFHHPPVHCSWMNQIEQWFSILQRKRLTIANFSSKEELAERLTAFISEWNECAHPFNWTYRSFEKILSKCEQVISINDVSTNPSQLTPQLLPRAA